MNTFVSAIENTPNYSLTENGALTLADSGSAIVDLFYKIGSMFSGDITKLFEAAFGSSNELAIRTLLWGRDIRGGAGRRDNFRKILLHLEKVRPDLLKKIIPHVPVYGRWDDLLIFQTTNIKNFAYSVYVEGLNDPDKVGLAAKWAPRKGRVAAELRNFIGLTPKEYRKMLVENTKVVETQMCAKDWGDVKYEHVPSVAASRYVNAFNRHDQARYVQYLNDVLSGEKKINASAVFPHDVLKNIGNGPSAVLAQWNTLPDYMNDRKVLPMIDVSGSMSFPVQGWGTTALQVAIALGLYMADKARGAFKDVTLTFSSESRIDILRGDIISKYHQLSNQHWEMSTDIQKAFQAVLNMAKQNNVPQTDMPEVLVIVSDMEFDYCVRGTNLTGMKIQYESAGYKMPEIVFWNVNGRDNNTPARYNEDGVMLISGYSPAILKSVLSGNAVSPIDLVMEVIMKDRYDIFK